MFKHRLFPSIMIFNFDKILFFSHFIKDFDIYYKISFCVIDGKSPSIKDTFTILYSMVGVFLIFIFCSAKASRLSYFDADNRINFGVFCAAA